MTAPLARAAATSRSRYGAGAPPALDRVTLDLLAGERLAVIGESGSGKTTLAAPSPGFCPRSRVAGEIDWAGRAARGPAATSASSSRIPAPASTRSCGRRADRRGAARAISACPAPAPVPARRELLERVRIPEPERGARRLPAPALRRPAPARRHRARHRRRARAPDRRRADQRARHDRPGRDRRRSSPSWCDEDGMTLLFVTHDIALAGTLPTASRFCRTAAWSRPAPPPGARPTPREPYTRALLAAHLDLASPPPRPRAGRSRARDAARGRGARARPTAVPAVSSALDGVSLAIAPGETLGLVGPSGSGKSTLARVVIRLVEPDAGTIGFDGLDWLALSGGALRRARGGMQMVFQDPPAAFNPRATVGGAIADPLRIHGIAPRRDRPAHVAALLAGVGLAPELARRPVASSPAASASASPSPAPSPRARSSSCSTRRSRRSTSRSAGASWSSSSGCRQSSASPISSSATTSPWCAPSRTASR